MTWIYPDLRRRERALRALFRLALADVAEAGRIDVARDAGCVVGAAAWLPPGTFPVPWRRQLASGPAFTRLVATAPASLPRLMRFLTACTDNFPTQPRWQLNVVGVTPGSQGRGIGRALLTSMVATVGDDMHLETWNPVNLPFYRGFGFRAAITDHPLGPAGPQRVVAHPRQPPAKGNDMSHQVLLATHVSAGTASLLLGPLVMYRQGRRMGPGRSPADRLWQFYVLLVVVVAVTAVVLVVTNRPELWWLIPVSLLTVALVVLAGESMRRRYAGWLHGYVHGMGGSYISVVTAFVVVALTVDGPVTGTASLVPWLAPTVVGTVGIEVWRRRLDRAMSRAERLR